MSDLPGVKHNMAKAALLIIVISSAGKLLGLVRESALAATFGATAESDAYKLAMDIPMILLWIISASVTTTFIPVYSDYIRNKTQMKTRYFLNNIFSIVMLLSVVFFVLGMLFTPQIVRVMASGFNEQALGLTTKLARAVMLSLMPYALYYIASAYLQVNNSFVIPALSWVVYNILIIAAIIFFSGAGIEAVTIGSAIAMVSLFVIQIPSIVKKGHRFGFLVDLNEAGFKRIAALSVPVMISSAFTELYFFFNRILASGLDQGSISALDYANKLYSMVFNIFILSVITVVYPNLSLVSDCKDAFKGILGKGIKMISVISFPTIAGFLALGVPIVKVLFERGAFDAHDTLITSNALAGFSIGILGIGISELLNRAFYSLKDTKTPMLNGIFTICINIVLNIVFVRIWGVGGLALGTSVAGTISAVILVICLSFKIEKVLTREIVATVLKSFFAAIVMGILVILINKLNEQAFPGEVFGMRLLRLVTGISAGAVIYTAMLYVLRVKEVGILVVKLTKEPIAVTIKRALKSNTV